MRSTLPSTRWTPPDCHARPFRGRPMRLSRAVEDLPDLDVTSLPPYPFLCPSQLSFEDVSYVTSGKSIDASGAGRSRISPGWLTQLGRLWGGKSDVPVVTATPADIKELLGGAMFSALYKWMNDHGDIYLLPTGPVSSFLVVSSPEAAKHVLTSSDNPRRNVYGKGLVAEVSRFLFGDGFAVAGGDRWRLRRRAVNPSFHKYIP